MDNQRRTIKRRIRRSTRKTNTLNHFLFIIFFMAIIVFTLYPDKTDVNAQDHWNEPVEIRVQPGDSLWVIAQNIPGSDGIDIRKAVYEIKKLNQLETSALKSGQILLIPASFN